MKWSKDHEILASVRQMTSIAVFCNGDRSQILLNHDICPKSWRIFVLKLPKPINNTFVYNCDVFCFLLLKNRTLLNFGSKLFHQNRMSWIYWRIFWWKPERPERNLATKSLKSQINTQLKLTTLVENNRKLINVYTSNKVLLSLFNAATGNSHTL